MGQFTVGDTTIMGNLVIIQQHHQAYQFPLISLQLFRLLLSLQVTLTLAF